VDVDDLVVRVDSWLHLASSAIGSTAKPGVYQKAGAPANVRAVVGTMLVRVE
jgi:hypothetical protein